MKGKYLTLLAFLFIFVNFNLYNYNNFSIIKNQNYEDLTASDLVILLEINGNQELAAYCYDGVNNGSSWDSAYLIEDFNALDVFQGIWIKNTNKCLIIQNCVFYNNIYGIMFEDCEKIRLINCTFYYCSVGIQIDGTNYGIDINKCAFYEGNNGCDLRGTNNVKINNSLFYEYYYGVELSGDQTIITNSLFYNSQSAGISIYGLNNSISNNNFTFGRGAVRVNGIYNNLINNNIKNVNGTGIFVEHERNLIAYNNIVNCNLDGIYLDAQLIDWGVYNIASYNKIIFNNISFNQGNGIHLIGTYSEGKWRGAAYNDIYNNTLMYNEQNGILLEYPSHNNIIHNNSILFNQQYCIIDRGYDNDYFQNGNCSIFYEPPILGEWIPGYNIILILEFMMILSILYVIVKFKRLKLKS